ncbi:hypothetical protein NDU88_004310 [Pleurodeles waltl]|uniref:Uncharacterized protein n=1 Tax=Pleurodeles waltl TaxID=8319 RepID=A0AAV7M778_PLEWA|nr:hypothetical protein NDU88_004310 [Pleurodeles waltl]
MAVLATSWAVGRPRGSTCDVECCLTSAWGGRLHWEGVEVLRHFKLYWVQMQEAPGDSLKDLPDNIPPDTLVASLVGRTSPAEDAIVRDYVDKKVDVALKKVYLGAHLALRAASYGTYVA